MTQGIYLIKNNVNNRHYVGQSKDIERRWSGHKCSTFNTNATDYDTPLHRAFRKHGIDNFTFEILEVVPNHSELNSIENKYIAKYNSIGNGYNQIITSRNGLSKEDINKRRELKYGVTRDKLYNQLMLDSFSKVASYYGVSDNTIRKWCRDFDIPDRASAYDTPEKRAKFKNNMKKLGKSNAVNCKRVAMIDMNSGDIIQEFDSIGSASEFMGVKRTAIAKALYGYEGRKSALGYRWSFIK